MARRPSSKPRKASKPAPAGPAPTAAQLRKLDAEIVDRLNARAEATLARGAASHPEPLDPAAIQIAAAGSAGPLPRSAVEGVFRELFSGIRAVQTLTRVAYLGPELTYSHLAAIARFGQSAELVPLPSIAGVFAAVERGDVTFGVVPIENSTDGRIADTLECFGRAHAMHAAEPSASGAGQPTAAARVQICAEAPLRIHHCLLGAGRRADVRRVASKPQALSQCRNWLAANLPGVATVEMASTAEAARLAAAHQDVAAIAGEQAAANHGLAVLARNIEDNADNVTRFAVVGLAAGTRTGRDKTALVFEAPHQPGALADAMAIFKRQRLNLTWIESFPVPAARGRYLFFVEFQGHAADVRVRRAIASLAKRALRLSVLGSYAEAEAIG